MEMMVLRHTQMAVIAVHDMSLSFLLNIYSGDRKYDDAMKMHLAKWYLAQTTRNAPRTPCMHHEP